MTHVSDLIVILVLVPSLAAVMFAVDSYLGCAPSRAVAGMLDDYTRRVRAARWEDERTTTVAMLRDICDEWGNNDWPDDLWLPDVIEKHLWRELGDDNPERRPVPGTPEVSCATESLCSRSSSSLASDTPNPLARP